MCATLSLTLIWRCCDHSFISFGAISACRPYEVWRLWRLTFDITMTLRPTILFLHYNPAPHTGGQKMLTCFAEALTFDKCVSSWKMALNAWLYHLLSLIIVHPAVKPKFHYMPTSPDGSLREVGVMQFGLKMTSRVCRGLVAGLHGKSA